MFIKSILGSFVCCSILVTANPVPGTTWKTALESPFGPELKQCKENWVAISDKEDPAEVAKCLRGLLLAVAPRLKEAEGVPALNVPQMDPIVKNEKVEFSKPPAVSVTIMNPSVTGLTNGLNEDQTSFVYDPENNELTMTVTGKKGLTSSAQYDIKMNPFLVSNDSTRPNSQLESSGTFTSVAEDVSVTVKVVMEQADGFGLRAISATSAMTAGSTTMNLEGDKPNDPLTALLNSKAMKDKFSRKLMENLVPELNNLIAGATKTLYEDGWDQLEQL